VRVDTADGRMLARILASIDQGEWERARERYMRKRQELIADGKWTGGHVGFGYRVEDGRSASSRRWTRSPTPACRCG